LIPTKPHRVKTVFLFNARPNRSTAMSLSAILLVLIILMLVGVLPTWPHSRQWGYAPSGGIGLVLVILLVLLLLGAI
jgi:hypothetical protein